MWAMMALSLLSLWRIKCVRKKVSWLSLFLIGLVCVEGGTNVDNWQFEALMNAVSEFQQQ